MNIAVISDIHGNADALSKVLESIKASEIDLTIVLGDLLTYGCQPNEVLQILMDYSQRHDSVFIKGNHDQFYFDLDNGIKEPSYKIPEFVDEAIQWTKSQIKDKSLESMFNWKESYVIGDIFFAHANPFEYGNWEYVESYDQCVKAAEVLRSKNFKIGVFGHSHRPKCAQINSNNDISEKSIKTYTQVGNGEILLLNAGSIGQPRGEGLNYLTLTLDGSELAIDFHEVDLDLGFSIELIKKTHMSEATKMRLISYLGSSN